MHLLNSVLLAKDRNTVDLDIAFRRFKQNLLKPLKVLFSRARFSNNKVSVATTQVYSNTLIHTRQNLDTYTIDLLLVPLYPSKMHRYSYQYG